MKKWSIATTYASTIKLQTHLDPSLCTFSARNLTLSDPSIFIDYKWKVYKNPCCSDHYPIINEKHYDWKLRTTNSDKIPTMEFLISKLAILQKLYLTTLIPETDTNQEPMIYFTNILITISNKTILKTQTIVHRGVEKHKRMSSNLQKIQNKTLIRKSKQIQRAKTQCTIKESKRSSLKVFTSKINSNINLKIIWNFIKKIWNKNINTPINHLSQGNTNTTSEKHIVNLIAENFAQVSSTQKSTQINSIRSKKRT